MSGFGTQPDALRSAGARLSEIESDIRQSFDPLRAQVDSLLSSGWTGGASRGFAEGWTQWLGGLEDCMLALAEMGRLLGITGDGYSKAEDMSLASVTQSGAPL